MTERFRMQKKKRGKKKRVSVRDAVLVIIVQYITFKMDH